MNTTRPDSTARRAPRPWHGFVRVLIACLVLLSAAAHAGGLQVVHAALAATDDHYTLDAQFNVELTPPLEDAVARGVTLAFVTEFQLTRPRSYWFDEHITSQTQTARLTYHALTRQYRVSRGPLHQNFTSLADALKILGRVREWSVAERADLRAGRTYIAELRMRLDMTQMPKPFQVYALSNKDWTLGSETHTWIFAPATEAAK